MANLDKSKPYGTVTGDSVVRYVQNGVEYRADGTPVNGAATSEPAEPGSSPTLAPNKGQQPQQGKK